jgi:hypothetical protein
VAELSREKRKPQSQKREKQKNSSQMTYIVYNLQSFSLLASKTKKIL